MGILHEDCYTVDGRVVDLDPACVFEKNPDGWAPPGYHPTSIHDWSLEDTLQAFGLTAGVALVIGAGAAGKSSYNVADFRGVSCFILMYYFSCVLPVPETVGPAASQSS